MSRPMRPVSRPTGASKDRPETATGPPKRFTGQPGRWSWLAAEGTSLLIVEQCVTHARELSDYLFSVEPRPGRLRRRAW